MTMATYTKVFLRFSKKFWFDTEVRRLHFIAMILWLTLYLQMALYADSERGRYPVWQSLDHENFFPGSGIMFVTVTVCLVLSNPRYSHILILTRDQGDQSVRIEGLSDSQVKSEVMGVVRSMFPNVTVPEPLEFFFPRWHSNPLFRGSYSNWPPSFSSQHLDNLRANVGRLYFAGEATSRKYFGQ